jgi:hypothetical protein
MSWWCLSHSSISLVSKVTIVVSIAVNAVAKVMSPVITIQVKKMIVAKPPSAMYCAALTLISVLPLFSFLFYYTIFCCICQVTLQLFLIIFFFLSLLLCLFAQVQLLSSLG